MEKIIMWSVGDTHYTLTEDNGVFVDYDYIELVDDAE